MKPRISFSISGQDLFELKREAPWSIEWQNNTSKTTWQEHNKSPSKIVKDINDSFTTASFGLMDRLLDRLLRTGLGVNPLVLNFRGNAFSQLGRFREALADYREATEIFRQDRLSPRHGEGH